jgi:hypothetical protein
VNPLGTILQFPEGSKVSFVDFVSADAPGLILSLFLSFDRALGFFGDGTLYLVDAPGHFEGHITALARVAPGTFVFLGADTCNNRECYTPGGGGWQAKRLTTMWREPGRLLRN